MAPELICVVPPHVPEDRRAALEAHLAPGGIRVIVERRSRRRHIPLDLRRKRALHLPRELPELPAELADLRDELRLVQRMPAPGLVHADDELLTVVDAVRAGDGVAASELVWRVNSRVHARLVHRLGKVEGQDRVDLALGRMLDRVDEFEGYEEVAFLVWLDGVVDEA